MHSSPLLPYFIFGTLLIVAFAIAVIISVVIQIQRQIKNRLARQQMLFAHNESLLNTRIEVREATLNMVAQELHDNVVQKMSGYFMEVNAASEFIQAQEGKAIISDAKEHIKNVIRDVRLLSHSLATGMVERKNLDEAIQAELTRVETFTKIKCSFDSKTFFELPPNERLLLFRAFQESLQNALKHAQAKNISVQTDTDERHFYLTIKDDGDGFDTARLANDSLGLMSIKERVEKLHGALLVTSEPGGGTTIKLQIPINQTDEEDKSSAG